jgi:hypothetical protein
MVRFQDIGLAPEGFQENFFRGTMRQGGFHFFQPYLTTKAPRHQEKLEKEFID